MNKNFTRCLELIIKAQVSSDGGKDIASELSELYPTEFEAGYALKDALLLRALQLIRNNKPFGVTYYVMRGKDQNGYNSNIIYFNFKTALGNRQVSFHNFSADIMRYANTGKRTSWRYAQTSRQNCIDLYNLYISPNC